MIEKSLLIIEDEPIFRNALTGRLQDEGFEVEAVESTAAGLKLLKKDLEARVIILDLNFPESSGEEFLDKLQSTPPRLHRTIIYTQFPNSLPHEKARDLRVFTYLTKSDNLEPLKFAIDHAFRDIEAEKLRRRMSAHLRIQEMINASDSKEQILDQICRSTLETTSTYTCHIRALDVDKGDYELFAYAGPDGPVISRSNKKISEDFSGTVAQLGRTRGYAKIQSDPGFQKFKKARLRESSSEATRTYLETIKAAYIVPIKTGLFDNKDQVDAVFNVSSDEEDFFDDDRVRIVEDFVAQTNLALSKMWLQEKREQIHNDYQLSNDLLVQVSGSLQEGDIESIYETVLKRVAEIIRPEMISLFMYEESTGRIENKAELVGKDEVRYEQHHEWYLPGQCLTGTVFATGESLLINDDPTGHEYYSSREETDRLDLPSQRIEHYMAVPLIAGNQTIGVIRAINKRSSYYDEIYPKVANNDICLLSRGFSRDCHLILGIIANHLAVTMKNLRLIEQLKALSKVGQQISANYGLDAENLLGMIVKETASVMNAAICMLFLKDERNVGVELKTSYGFEQPIEDCYYTLGDGAVGKVAKTGVPFRKAKGEPGFGKFDTEILKRLKDQHGKETEIGSYMVVPITIEGKSSTQQDDIIGVLTVITKRPGQTEFTESDLNLFQTFASQISVAMAMSERNNSLFKLVHGVGHEMQNTAMQIPHLVPMALRELKRNRPDLDYVREMLGTIEQAFKQASEFTQDLLDFSDNKFVKKSRVDPKMLIKRVVDDLMKTPPISVKNANDVKVRYRFSNEDLICKLYRVPFQCAVRNIVVNAYQAMENTKMGVLKVKCYKRAHKAGETTREIAVIEFTDNGKGIEAEDLKKVFMSRFSKGKKGGNGLGLWLVKLSLLRMEGEIRVTSHLGKWTTFTIEIPVVSKRKSKQ